VAVVPESALPHTTIHAAQAASSDVVVCWEERGLGRGGEGREHPSPFSTFPPTTCLWRFISTPCHIRLFPIYTLKSYSRKWFFNNPRQKEVPITSRLSHALYNRQRRIQGESGYGFPSGLSVTLSPQLVENCACAEGQRTTYSKYHANSLIFM